MKRLAPLLLLLVLAPPAGADGCPPSTCGTTSSAVPGSRTLTVRPEGSMGPLIAYDVVDGRKRFTLPAGILSADRSTFVSARMFTREGVTRFTRYDARTGRRLARWTRRGEYTVAAVSTTGSRLVAFQARRPPHGKTHFVVLDGRGNDVARFGLPGTYEVEALSPDDNRIYLVHWRRNGYELKQYDLRARRVRPTPTFEPDGAEEDMTGTAWTALASRDGRWLLTLYVEIDEATSFVHAFDLRKGIGYCVDLPVRAGPMALGVTALTLSPDERTVYVASPLLGRVITIALRQPRVVRKASFRAVPMKKYGFGIGPSGAISRDGRTLAFAGDREVWRYDTRRGAVIARTPRGRYISGVAFAPDGRLGVLRTSGQFTFVSTR